MEYEYAKIAETVWFCMNCKKQQETDRNESKFEFFLRNVDEIVRTMRGEPGVVLEAANKLHPNGLLTIETLDSNGNLPFWF